MGHGQTPLVANVNLMTNLMFRHPNKWPGFQKIHCIDFRGTSVSFDAFEHCGP